MKQLIFLAFLLLSVTGFSQTKKTVKSGYITFNSNTMFEFKNMTIEKDSVTYYNDVAKNQMGFNLRAVKKIVDNYGATVYEKDNKTALERAYEKEVVLKVAQSRKTSEELLVYKNSSKIMLNGERLSDDKLKELLKADTAIYNNYNKGETNAVLGDILIGGGIGMFVGGGIRNVRLANSNKEGGGPELLIIGLVTTIVGIPIRCAGVKKIKEAVYDYNQLPRQQISFLNRAEVKVIAGGNGIGLQLQF